MNNSFETPFSAPETQLEQKKKGRIKKLLRKKWFIATFVIIAILVIGGAARATRNQGPQHDTMIVERGDLEQVVTVSGLVKPADKVDLAFERSGKV